MQFSSINVCIQVKCISCGSSCFASKISEKRSFKNLEIRKEELENNDERDKLKLKKLVGNVYIGKVLNVGGTEVDIIKGKNIIGIITLNSKIRNDKIIAPYQDIIEYPCNDINYDYKLCAVLRSLYESYICLNSINCKDNFDYITIFADDISPVLPFLKLLLVRKFFIFLFLCKEDINKHNMKKKLEEFHISSNCFEERVSILSIEMNIPEHVHNITNRLGVKTIVVYPNVLIDINVLKKNIFTISSFNANLIFTYQFDYLSPHECKLLHEKGITVHFFNITNYVYYDYFKTVDAFNYALLSLLNKDIDMPSVCINKKYFSHLEEILTATPHEGTYSVYVNQDMDL
ncbi:conserved Plasmodium protein, unknown function [Plasmodium ovale]|uniref:Uncharacterized protein n=1 Tax=Plasmodium ovale TaxID=36330 RepID=A0A1D3U840_PLAOA|nr:conserved Plasmodium protein, unknown function [Plasmodium ovale]